MNVPPNSDDDILPIRLRDNCVVRISGLPHDIAAEEAAKIIRVIQAMVPPVPRGRPRNATRPPPPGVPQQR